LNIGRGEEYWEGRIMEWKRRRSIGKRKIDEEQKRRV
jgi:hypothetical protein